MRKQGRIFTTEDTENGVMIKTSGYWYTNRCSKEQLPVVASVGAAYDPVRTLNNR
jgi:hypothetical protein